MEKYNSKYVERLEALVDLMIIAVEQAASIIDPVKLNLVNDKVAEKNLYAAIQAASDLHTDFNDEEG